MAKLFTKAELRKELVYFLSKKSAAMLQEAGKAAAQHLRPWLSKHEAQLGSHLVASYIPLSDEISTESVNQLFINLGMEIFLPKTKPLPHFSSQLTGLTAKISELAIIILPGRAFDLKGNRLGRGGGYYDRALAPLAHGKKSPILIGLGLDEQVFEEIPVEEHDKKVDYICTPTKLIKI